MNTQTRRRRAAAALTALAFGAASIAAGMGAISAEAAPVRNAATSTDTSYLSDTLGVPAGTVLETVTYDRFQWLLQQSGQFAFLVGDPAEDVNFKAQAVAVDAAARTAGVAKIYWFDPNLSGNAKLVSGNTTTITPNLDIRNPPGITTVSAASQAIYGNAWKSLVGQYLGNGLKAGVTGLYSESAKVTTTVDATTINDTTAPLYDYSAGTPSTANDSTFFIYDKDNTSGSPAKPDKLVHSVDLDTDVSYAADVAAAFTAAGGSTIDTIGQFAFWRDEVNKKEAQQASDTTAYGDGTVLDGSDNDQPWAVQQITYPELVHLLSLKDSTNQNFTILFGGTWCPNTRAVIKDVNAQAQNNGVTVYNFDTVLDGGTVGGGTTSASNPLQVRNTANSGTTVNANPSFVYASIVTTFLKNIVTEYDLNNGSYVTYYANGDTTKTLAAVRKLQVPFLINYQRGIASAPSSTAIKRQWIKQNNDPSTGLPAFKEYMSEFYWTNPASGRIGLTAAQFPTAIATIPGLAGFDWKNPTYPNTTTNADDNAYLVQSDVDGLTAAILAVPSASSFASVADVTDAIAAANAATPVDTALVTNLTTIKTDWNLAQLRKGYITTQLANVAFGLEAVAKLGSFFGGLPGGVASTQTVTAPAVVYGTSPTVTVAVANDYGRVPTGTVSLSINGHTYTQDVAANAASFTLPVFTPGSYGYTVSYSGDDQILAFSKTGALSVVKSQTSSVSAAVAVSPSQTATGSYAVSVGVPAGLVAPTGIVTATLTNGSTSATFSGALVNGTTVIALPKLAVGTWSAVVAWVGDANYPAASTTGGIAVSKVAVSKIAGTASKKPTSKKAGKYKVAVSVPSGIPAATGKVTLRVKKGKVTRTITGTLAQGKVTVKVPKLAKGTWAVAITWPGNANLVAASAKGSIKVKK